VLHHGSRAAAGVVNAGVRRHGGQAQGGAQADAVESHLIDAVFHRGNASCRRVPGSIHLVRQLLHQRLQPVELSVAVCSICGTMMVSSKLS
jgi:hypothetical protein